MFTLTPSTVHRDLCNELITRNPKEEGSLGSRSGFCGVWGLGFGFRGPLRFRVEFHGAY